MFVEFRNDKLKKGPTDSERKGSTLVFHPFFGFFFSPLDGEGGLGGARDSPFQSHDALMLKNASIIHL